MNEINFTRAGLLNAAQHGLTPDDVWQVLDSRRRLIYPVGEQTRLVLGFTSDGRGLAVLVRENKSMDDVWEVISARPLTDRETEHMSFIRRRQLR